MICIKETSDYLYLDDLSVTNKIGQYLSFTDLLILLTILIKDTADL